MVRKIKSGILLKRRERKRKGLLRQDAIYGWLFILPQIAGVLLFLLYPFVFSIFISFHKWRLLSPPNLIGLDNYRMLLQDSLFHQILGNTLYFVGASIPLSMAGALLLALLVNRPLKGISIFRSIFYLPVVCAWVAVAFIWKCMLQPEMGVINYLLGLVGIEGPTWLNSTTWAMPSVIAVNVWKSLGFNMILFLAGLQSIPEMFYEAAEIDGAGRWHRFSHITLPLLTPTIFFVLITSIIFSFQAFTEIYVMTDGGPAYTTAVIVWRIWYVAFQQFRMGYACSMAWTLFGFILIFTLFQWKSAKYWVHYQV